MNMYCIAKVKFDLRDPDEIYFAQKEIDSLLGVKTEFLKTLACLFRERPFNLLDEEVIHLINRLVYLGEGQGFLAKVPLMNIVNIVNKAAFFREIYAIFETEDIKEILEKIGLAVKNELFDVGKVNPNPYTQIFIKSVENHKNKLVTVRFIPFHTLFEYVTEVKKLPASVFSPKNSKNWNDYFTEKESGIEKCLVELIEHLKNGHYRSPHFGFGKNHIGDFVDWASTDLRKPFLHYLHKYKGKGDPRISRALINLLQVKEGDTILDPFVGSGAFVADAPTMGLNAIGIEVLNIGKMIAEVKCNLSLDIAILKRETVKLFESIEGNLLSKNIKTELIEKIRKNTLNSTALKKIEPHLNKILFLKEEIENIEDERIRQFF